MSNLHKISAMVLFCSCVSVFAQSNKNYIIEKNYIQPKINSSSNIGDFNTHVSYFDGLGRKIQEITTEQDIHNLVKNYEYDENNVLKKKYLYHTNTNLNFVTNSRDLLFHKYNVSNPYSENRYDKGSYRIIEKGYPGSHWDIENNDNHTKKIEYLFNAENEVKKYLITNTLDNDVITNILSLSGHYPKNTLRKEIQKNENWKSNMGKNNTIEMFFDENNNMILSRSYDEGISLDTYYLYNKLNQCVAVLPPMANGDVFSENIKKWCYLYNYDTKGRLVEKKLPQKEWEYIIYDNAGRVVMTGPIYNPFGENTKGWFITKYDAFGRSIYTGYYDYNSFDSATRNSLAQNNFVVENRTGENTIDGITVNYSNNSFPTNFKLLSVNYYDNYLYPNAPTSFPTIGTQTVNTMVKGHLTGSWKRVLTTSTNTAGIVSYNLYDDKFRVIRSYITNHLGGYTQVDSELAFTGVPTKTLTTQKQSTNATVLTITDNFTFDRLSRLLTHTKQINSNAIERIVSNTYDELGVLIGKDIGGVSGNLQNIDYKYNIRGWLTDINSQGLETELYSQKLFYNEPKKTSLATGAWISNPLYNGNISYIESHTKSDNIIRGYRYNYDHLDRLKEADFYEGLLLLSTNPTGYYKEYLTYDRNGNILTLNRTSKINDQKVDIDELTYTYSGNQLQAVNDATNHPEGFRNGNTVGNDYIYDSFGNITKDLNKQISSVTYNHLNLPYQVTFANGGNIKYTYDAAGTRLSKKVQPSGGSLVTTDYVNGFQYENNVLQFFPHAEGYVKRNTNNTYLYVYQYKDHLGNIRLSYADVNGNGTIEPATEILEENNYYPFGLKHKGYNEIVNSNRSEVAEKYKFGGKELNDELGLDLYDFGARNYDPSLGRWLNVDPLAEEFAGWTPYHYVHNNPINLIDPTGMSAEPPSTHIDEEGNVLAVKNDGNLGIYQHSSKDIKSGNLDNDSDKQVGVTLFENSFSKGDKIDIGSFRAKEWIDSFEGNQKALVGIQPIGIARKGWYAINARNGQAFDPKSYLSGGVGGGSQISEGVYISNRDLGNFAAGAFARINGYDKVEYMMQTGAFQLSGNNLSKFTKNYNFYMNQARNHTATDGAFQRTYGEDNRSNYFIRLGYDNIRTLESFNTNFKKIFKP